MVVLVITWFPHCGMAHFIFRSADVAVVTKIDLASSVEFDWNAGYGNIQAVRPGMPVQKLSAKTGEGMEDYLNFLTARRDELRAAVAS